MIRSQLQEYRGDDPTWGFVAQLGAEQFTGEVELGTATRARLFVDEGAVYFAERDGDAPVQSRLVVRGALSPAQLARGGVFVDGTISLARLFTRDTSIDRHEVENALERLTEEVLNEVGPQPAGQIQLTPLRHHDTGIHEWARRIQPPVIRATPLVAPVAPVRPITPVAPLTIAVPPSPPAEPLAAPTVPSAATVAPLAAPIAPLTGFAAPQADSPFSAPPAQATAAPLPAPSPTQVPEAPDVEESLDVAVEPPVAEPLSIETAPAEPGDRYTPGDFTSMELPKLATKVMSVAEITAAHSVVSGEAAPAEAGDRYTPTDFSTMELPKLATKVMSVAEITAKLAEPAPAPEPEPEPEPELEVIPDAETEMSAGGGTVFDSGPLRTIDAAPMPGLPTLHMGPSESFTTSDESSDAELENDHDTITDHDPVTEFDDEREAAPIAPWATPAQNLAAVEIWEMVDTLLAEEPDDSDLVSAGGPTDHKGGRWRRGRKG